MIKRFTQYQLYLEYGEKKLLCFQLWPSTHFISPIAHYFRKMAKKIVIIPSSSYSPLSLRQSPPPQGRWAKIKFFEKWSLWIKTFNVLQFCGTKGATHYFWGIFFKFVNDGSIVLVFFPKVINFEFWQWKIARLRFTPPKLIPNFQTPLVLEFLKS